MQKIAQEAPEMEAKTAMGKDLIIVVVGSRNVYLKFM
jgi:hypothetical protein